ncbi:MAG TPA: NUDIX domain-containing protein [Thermotogota bacterium]|nr:NUDIX domain-containing protein [Thermotogota bacterium]HPJ89881.1 NUDIX domain-containing protein [Thermotogota bacterium]HPR97118.1 NUDIX domain-containing protein [Thermotogota bacterium]
MDGYMMSLRKKLGKIPLIQTGSAMIFVNDEGKILMILNKATRNWGFPGGSMELGESLEDCARREAMEEVGLTAGKVELLDIFSGDYMHYFYPNGDEVYNVAAVYTCRDYSGKITPDGLECDVAEYLDPFDLPENVTGFVLSIVERYREKYQQIDLV